MVLLVRHVINNEPLHGNRLWLISKTFSLKRVLRDALHYFNEVPVIYLPKGDDVGGWHIVVAAAVVPLVLRVDYERGVLELGPDEALVVIGGAIYQVANFLLRAPLVWGGFVGKLVFRDCL